MKSPTAWNSNPSGEANEFAYDDSTVAYDSTTHNYDGVVDTNMSDRGMTPQDWDNVSKLPTGWSGPASKPPTTWSPA